MDEKRKRLLELVEELKFPLLSEEAKENAEKLSEEDLDLLLHTYEDLKTYRAEIGTAARNVNPEKYKKVQEYYQKKMLDLDLEYADKLEEVQSEEDKELEKIEAEEEGKIDKTTQEVNEKIQKAEDISDSLIARVRAMFSSN